MTLRARLTAAFLAVVLGPVVLGALFVGGTAAAVNRSRSLDRLDLAATALRGTVDVLCERLAAAAQTAAVTSAGGQDTRAAQRVVDDGLADAVYLVDATGRALLATSDAPPLPWTDCAAGDAPGAGVAIAARVAMHDASGQTIGYAYAAARVDAQLLGRLAAAAGASVTLIGGAGSPLSTERSDRARQIALVAGGLVGSTVGHTADGRYVRRLAPSAGQPLPLAVSVAYPAQAGLYLLLVLIVLLAAGLTVAVAWWLARGTTRPLAELATAAGRVAGGDLSARVPVRTRDEVGRLGLTFNRMTREMQSYVEALTASRDQLRGHLGLLGDTLSSTHDLQRMLQVILRTALAATSAQAGVVLLAEPGEGVLVGQCEHGLAERGAVDWPVRLPLGAGLLGAVAQTGESRRGQLERDAPALAEGEPRGRTYIAVPFSTRRPPGSDRAEHAVRGVLALYDRLGGDEFDDADQVTLRTFAAQAAVAVENVRIHEEAQRLSYTDPLTGLYNYRMLRDSLRREVERASRFGHRLCVLVLDLDRFKEVNDSYGHAAGDVVLAEFAHRLSAEVREVDLAFRQGGEEFVLLLPETDTLGGITLAERLGTAMRGTAMTVTARRIPDEHRRQAPVGRQPDGPARTLRIPVTVSIGIAVFPDHGTSGAAVLDAADDALYVAKADGRDTYRVAGSLRQSRSSGEAASDAARDTATLAPAPVASPALESGAPGGPHAPRQSRGR